MAYSYDEIQGSPQNPDDHESDTGHNRTQYAGDVIPLSITPGPNSGQTSDAYVSARLAIGADKSPNILPIGRATTQAWSDRNKSRMK